jgi:hypothetical protein
MSSRKIVEKILSEFGAVPVEDIGLVGVVPIFPELKRSQKVMVLWNYDGESFWIASTFASQGDLTAQMALKLSEDIPYGIGTLNGDFQLKHFMQFSEVEPNSLKSHYIRVGVFADQLEEYTGNDTH